MAKHVELTAVQRLIDVTRLELFSSGGKAIGLGTAVLEHHGQKRMLREAKGLHTMVSFLFGPIASASSFLFSPASLPIQSSARA